MYKITETFVDYNGVERTQSFLFNLTEEELVKKEMGTTGGLKEMMEKLIDTKDVPAIMRIFEELVLEAYGVKSDDGLRFEKSEDLRNAFKQHPAYSAIYMRLSFDAKAAAEFINGIVPAHISDEMKKQEAAKLIPAAE
jgi:hypothetical protein